MKRNFLSEIRRLEPKNPWKKYEGKFFNDQSWWLYLSKEWLDDLSSQGIEDRFEFVFSGSFSECFKFLEQRNLISYEAEQLAPYNGSVKQHTKVQADYRNKLIKECFERGAFETETWLIHHEILIDEISRGEN